VFSPLFCPERGWHPLPPDPLDKVSDFRSIKTMDILNCQFSLPTELATGTWAYSEMNCSSSLMAEISDGTSTFGLVKTMSFGDYFLVFFCVVFALSFILDFIFKFIYKIKVNFRH
jgi:hypothetical protein